jgi:hypothetical protein
MEMPRHGGPARLSRLTRGSACVPGQGARSVGCPSTSCHEANGATHAIRHGLLPCLHGPSRDLASAKQIARLARGSRARPYSGLGPPLALPTPRCQMTEAGCSFDCRYRSASRQPSGQAADYVVFGPQAQARCLVRALSGRIRWGGRAGAAACGGNTVPGHGKRAGLVEPRRGNGRVSAFYAAGAGRSVWSSGKESAVSSRCGGDPAQGRGSRPARAEIGSCLAYQVAVFWKEYNAVAARSSTRRVGPTPRTAAARCLQGHCRLAGSELPLCDHGTTVAPWLGARLGSSPLVGGDGS